MDTMEVGSSEDKKKRKRNKQLLKSIRQQVEFYFGDANLRKDRFLGQEISQSQDRYVEIATIASFNRMQVLCSDPSLISQALSMSDTLELNDDKTRIRRKEPLGDPEFDPDDVTVYVECLPKMVDHDWLHRVFGVCGAVEYVSLPRYKSSGDIKGFAFIEFKTPQEATRACEMIHNPPEEETGKIGKFPKTKSGRYVPVEEDKTKDGNQRDNSSRTSNRKRSYSENDNKSDNQKRLKRKHRESESSDGKPDRHRRKRYNSDGDKTKTDRDKTKTEKAGDNEKRHDRTKTDGAGDNVVNEQKRNNKTDQEKDKSTMDSEEKELESKKISKEEKKSEQVDEKSKDKENSKSRKRKLTDSDSEDDGGSKKNRRDSGDRSKGHDLSEDVNERSNDDDTKNDSDNEEKGRKKRSRKRKPEKKKETKENDLQLRVISKREWLDLKHKYLSLQKASITKLKEAWRTGGVANVIKSEEPTDKVFKSTEPEFTSGVVLKIESKIPVESRQQLKDNLQTVAPVAYIDLQPGEQSGFVRCKSTEGASQILNKYGPSETSSNISVTLLAGDDETQYWEKLKADRVNKLTSKQKKKKKRGVDRVSVLGKAEKVSFVGSGSGGHIRFDDD